MRFTDPTGLLPYDCSYTDGTGQRVQSTCYDQQGSSTYDEQYSPEIRSQLDSISGSWAGVDAAFREQTREDRGKAAEEFERAVTGQAARESWIAQEGPVPCGPGGPGCDDRSQAMRTDLEKKMDSLAEQHFSRGSTYKDPRTGKQMDVATAGRTLRREFIGFILQSDKDPKVFKLSKQMVVGAEGVAHDRT